MANEIAPATEEVPFATDEDFAALLEESFGVSESL